MNFAVVGTNFISDNSCVSAKKVANVTATYSRTQKTEFFCKKHNIANICAQYENILAVEDIYSSLGADF